jgi:GDP-mannose 4,6 dehydratase
VEVTPFNATKLGFHFTDSTHNMISCRRYPIGRLLSGLNFHKVLGFFTFCLALSLSLSALTVDAVISTKNFGISKNSRSNYLGTIMSAMVNGGQSSAAAPAWPNNGNKQILITGGAGYIGTHTIVCLLEAGYDVTVVDNLVNSNEESLRRVQSICGCDSKRIRFYNVDLCDKAALEQVFTTSPQFHACIHFAGRAYSCSIAFPCRYFLVYETLDPS